MGSTDGQAQYTLYLGDKNYSSWSLRPWLALRQLGIAFTEVEVPLGGTGVNERHLAYSPNGLVPCLHDGDLQVFDSLAICEYLAERHPQLWPAERTARARARSIAAEMHSGFGQVRNQLPMNIRLRARGTALPAAVQKEVDRICLAWRDARTHLASGDGPFLFGAFSIADAMFAPVVWRFYSYNVALPADAAAYRDTMLALPAMREWQAAAEASTWRNPGQDELIHQHGGARV